MDSLAKSTKYLGKKLYLSYTNTSRKCTEGNMSQTSTNFIPKPDKDITRKVQTDVTHEYTHKSSQQNISKSNLEYIKGIIHQVEFITGM